MQGGWVYIVTNRPNGTLYVGATSDLARRAWEHREGVADGAHRLGLADRRGDRVIARGLAARDAAERLPDPPLETGGAQIERQVDRRLGARQMREDGGHRRHQPRIGAGDRRGGIFR